VLKFFGQEAIGGIIYGLILGYLGYYLIRSVKDEPKIDVLISLAIVLGGYALASLFHVSGPLALVMAGLFMGQKLHGNTITRPAKEYLRIFWEILDEVLNAVLFVMIGLEILVLGFEWYYLWAGFSVIVISLVTRYFTVGVTYSMIRHKKDPKPRETIFLLTWGGLRGAISIALAMSIQIQEIRELFVFMTYCVVVFTIIVQGLTIKTIVKKISPKPTDI